MQVTKANGTLAERDDSKIQGHCKWACKGLEDLGVCQSELEASLSLQFYDGMPTKEIAEALIQTSRNLISAAAPGYDLVTARFTIQKIYKEVTGGDIKYPPLRSYVSKGVFFNQLDKRLIDGRFDLDMLDTYINPERDFQFAYLGIQTIADRYLLTEPRKTGVAKKVYEMPQHFWMRVAMGLAILEDDPTARAIEFYNLISSFDYCPSTPTLFNSGTKRPQMSSCYVGYVPDDLEDIFTYGFTKNALLSKFAGGIGTDWTAVRCNGSIIESTNGVSNGVVPFLKIFNQTAVAVNQGGKRKGAFAPYLEVWHGDVFEFCDLRLQTGDDNLRAHEIHPAVWIPDLFMERKEAGEDWSLFCPSDCPDLHDLYGEAFKKRYEEYEASGIARRVVPAMDLWKYMLDKAVRTGYPWFNFKDNCNNRNPQAHVGVIHNSNLCTEITLNNSRDEIAVCNLGSINAAQHVVNGRIDSDKLQRTINTAVRMLDNVIDINLYPVPEAENSNLKHRPIGLGIMGYSDALVACGIHWESAEHLEWADELFEMFNFYSVNASADLAIERGAYPTFQGSTWSQGKLTIDTVPDHLDHETHVFAKQEWQNLRDKVMATGIRNSNIHALAPTATIANIIGVNECIQLPNELEIEKENLSGRFIQLNSLVKYNRPDLALTVWDVNQIWTIDAACKRQKWIDQSQSLNLYRKAEDKGKTLDAWYTRLWRKGGKTSYYLRNQKAKAITHGEDAEVADLQVHNAFPAVTLELPIHDAQASSQEPDEPFVCEACQ